MAESETHKTGDEALHQLDETTESRGDSRPLGTTDELRSLYKSRERSLSRGRDERRDQRDAYLESLKGNAALRSNLETGYHNLDADDAEVWRKCREQRSQYTAPGPGGDQAERAISTPRWEFPKQQDSRPVIPSGTLRSPSPRRPIQRQRSSRRADDSDDSESTTTSTGSRGPRPRGPYMRPDKYDGTSVELREYLGHFNVVADVNKWNTSEKGMYLAGSLTGEARRILTDFREAEYRDWTLLVSKLEERFDPKCQEESHRAALRNRSRQKKETPQEFGYAIRRLVNRSYPHLNEAARETIALEHFMRGHTEVNLKVMALMKNLQTIEEAATFVAQYESAQPPRAVKPINTLEVKPTALPTEEAVMQLNEPSQTTGPRLPYIKGLFEAQDKKTNQVLELLKALLQKEGAGAARQNQYRGGGYNQRGPERAPHQGATGVRPNPAHVPAANAPQYPPRECWNCRQSGHISRNCPNKEQTLRLLQRVTDALTGEGEDLDGPWTENEEGPS